MRISIIIETRAACPGLAREVSASAASLQADGVETETILVAHGGARPAPLDGLRVIEVDTADANEARNAGVAACSGDAVLFLDGAVQAPAALLPSYARTLRAHPEAALLAGPVLPGFAGTAPAWASEAAAACPSVWALVTPAGPSRPIDPTRGDVPSGANLLVRRAALGRGLRVNAPRGMAERTLLDRVLALQGQARWVAEAGVTRIIPEDELTLDTLAAHFHAMGAAEVLARTGRPHSTRIRRTARLGRAAARYGVLRIWGRPEHWVPAYAAMHRGLGHRAAFEQLLRQAETARLSGSGAVFAPDLSRP